MKVQSVHSIDITLAPGKRATRDTPAERPKTQTIPPNALFEMEEGEEMDALRAAKAIKDPDGKHSVDLTVSQPQGSMQTGARLAAGSTVFNRSSPAPTGAKATKSEGQDGQILGGQGNRLTDGEGDEGGENGGDDDSEDLSAMTRDELNALAREEGIAEPEKMGKKQDVIDAIEQARLV